jgi:rod shape-determining protein MreC
MESFFTRYRNPMILGIVLLLQVFGLAVQLKRPVDPRHPEAGSVRMIRLWVSTVITPVERLFVGTGNFFRQSWHDYVNVGGLRRENEELRAQNEQLRINQSQIEEQAAKAQRLEQLLEFKQHFGIKTVAAQVIGSSGTEQSHLLLIDRGWRDGLAPDMAVVTPEGVVGKLRDVFPFTAQVLVVNDATSGVGALLENSRLHGVVKGTSTGGLMLDHVMVDEKVDPGDRVLTSGGDRIYPKGFPVGTVVDVRPGADLFLNIRLKPAAELNRLEEVLVVTEPPPAQVETEAPIRAADILAQRLPSITAKTQDNAAGTAAKGSAAASQIGKTTTKTPEATPAPGTMPPNPKAIKPLGTTTGTAPGTTPPAVSGSTAPAGAARVTKSTGAQGTGAGAKKTVPGTTSGAPRTANPAATPQPSGESAPPAVAKPTPTPPPVPTATPPASTPATSTPATSNPNPEAPKLQ